MFLVLSFLLVAGLDQLSMANAQPTTGSNVIAEIRRALESNTELRNVVKYLNLSEAVLLQKLTQTGNGVTFFAPTNWAFIKMLPQDIADPFSVDDELRETVLLHHFVQNSLTPNDLLKAQELIMADQKPSTLTRIANSGVKINRANINMKPIPIGSNLGVVYVVDHVFTTAEEIQKAISRHPAVETPWGPIAPQDAQNTGENVESHTVVVDLVAEFLREEAAAAAAAAGLP